MQKQLRYTLVDVSGLIYQTLTSPAALTVSSKTRIPLAGQIFILTKTLLKIATYRPLIFVLDGYPKWRFDKYPNYQKAGEGGRSSYTVKRVADGDEQKFKLMKKQLFSYVACYPTWFAKSETNQADDTIAYIIANHPEIQFDVLSRDLDMLGLLSYPNARVLYIPPKGNIRAFTSAEEVKAEIGVLPHQFPVYKAWLGDDSDNLIRVPDMRKKLLLEKVIGDATTLDESIANLEANKDSKGMVTKTRNWYETCVEHIPKARINYSVADFNLMIGDMTFQRYPGQPLPQLQALYQRYSIESIDPLEMIENYGIHNKVQCFLESA